MTLEELHEEIAVALTKISLMMKQMQNISIDLCERAQQCDADETDVMVAMMGYINTLNNMKAAVENDNQT